MVETVPEQSVNYRRGIRTGPYGGGMAISEHVGRSVLVVDDEPMVREVVSSYLKRDGLMVSEAADGLAALEYLERQQPDLVILDVMLPGLDGFSLLSSLRRVAEIPVIMLTARGDEVDRILGLELGADDYVVKPFSPRELAARVRAILKRSSSNSRTPDSVVEVGEFRIDPLTREAWVSGTSLELKPREFDLLLFMANHPRQVFSRGQLLEQVWEAYGNVAFLRARVQALGVVAHPTRSGASTPHVYVRMYDDERDRLARICKLALDAGIAERAIALAEQQADAMVVIVNLVLDSLDLPVKRRDAAEGVAAEALREMGELEVQLPRNGQN